MNKLKMIASMLIFGTIGIFVQYVPLSSALIACVRAAIGTIFLAAVMLIGRKRPDMAAIRKNLRYLLPAGVALGFNWIMLFEAYRYTTVAVATLCYYMAPVFVIVLSPLVLKEKLTPGKIVCTIIAVAGAALISGVSAMAGSLRGVMLGLSAAVLYCSIVLLNKFVRDISALETTFCQLAISAAVMLAYVLANGDLAALSGLALTPRVVLMALIMGIVHTGVAYFLYFSSVGHMPMQTAAVLSYVDPVSAIILSALLLSQPMTLLQIFGAVLILGSALANEVLLPRLGKNKN